MKDCLWSLRFFGQGKILSDKTEKKSIDVSNIFKDMLNWGQFCLLKMLSNLYETVV